MNSVRTAIIQTDAQERPDINRSRAVEWIYRAAEQGAALVVLPETFLYTGDLDVMARHAETIPGPTAAALQEAARACGVYLIGGSFLEKIPGKDRVYNTCLFIGPDGRIRSTYRKIHLFEIDAPGEVVFDESCAVEYGSDVVVNETPFGNVGFTICYDLRFPELYRALADLNAHIIAAPAAFAMKTGKDHWEVLLRARAIENQVYILAAAQVGVKPNGYLCYGRSMIIDPWGTIIAQASDTETMIFADLDMTYLEKVRRVMPALKNRRLGCN